MLPDCQHSDKTVAEVVAQNGVGRESFIGRMETASRAFAIYALGRRYLGWHAESASAASEMPTYQQVATASYLKPLLARCCREWRSMGANLKHGYWPLSEGQFVARNISDSTTTPLATEDS